HRVEAPGEVVHVRRKDQAPPRDLVAHEIGGEPFALRDALHLGSDGALTGEVHLGEAGHTELPSPVRTGSVSKGVISARHAWRGRSEEHTSELQSLAYLVCRLLLEKKKTSSE